MYGWNSQAESVPSSSCIDAQRRECSCGIAASAPVEIERRLVGRGREARELRPFSSRRSANASHVAVSSRRDVARERRAAREDHRRAERRIAATAQTSGQPALARGPPGEGERQAGKREGDEKRRGQAGGRGVRRREERDDDDRGEAERQQQLTREPQTGRALEQQAAAEREQPEDERKHQPGDDETHRGGLILGRGPQPSRPMARLRHMRTRHRRSCARFVPAICDI